MPRGHPAIWTEADIAILRSAVADNCTMGQILLRLGSKFGAKSVRYKLIAEGLWQTRNVAVVPWSEADTETLRKCIAEGLTALQTAARMGRRYSRVAIINRAKRIGLNFGHGLNAVAAMRHDDNVANSKFHGGQKAHQIAMKSETKKIPRRTTAAGLTRAEIDALPEPEAIGPLDDFPQSRTACRNIKGDPLVSGWRCCGQPVVAPGRSYCPIHTVKSIDPSGDAGRAPHWLGYRGVAGKVLA